VWSSTPPGDSTQQVFVSKLSGEQDSTLSSFTEQLLVVVEGNASLFMRKQDSRGINVGNIRCQSSIAEGLDDSEL
jgi:hypothetical protein